MPDIEQIASSVESIRKTFEQHRYICSNQIATAVYLAYHLKKPVLIEGPPGVGKTELAKTTAHDVRSAADPPAVLRGARRSQGAVRVEVRQAAAVHAGAEGNARRSAAGREGVQGIRQPAARVRRHLLLRGIPRAAAAAEGAEGRARLRAADRRGRQVRPRVRVAAARNPVRLPGLDSRDRHGARPRPSRRSCS